MATLEPPGAQDLRPEPDATAPHGPPPDGPLKTVLPSLEQLAGVDVRCEPVQGGVGLQLEDDCLSVIVVAALWTDPRPDPTGSVFANGVTFTVENRDGVSRLTRVDSAGAATRVEVPTTNGARLTILTTPRSMLVAVLNFVGTMVFDAETLEGLAGWKGMGSWFNATTIGAVASPDGKWLAVPDPYSKRLDLVRVSDLASVGSLFLKNDVEMDHGPGAVQWLNGQLEITTFPLPYE